MAGLEIESEKKGEILFIHFSGEIGLSEEYKFRQEVNEALKDAPDKVVLGLQRISLLSSYGIAAIVNLWKQQHARGGKITIVCPHNHVYDCLTIAGTDKIIPIFETEGEAVKDLEGK